VLTILPLAFAAALYPTLLAGVIVILSRPAPKRLLVAFLLGGLLISVTSGLIIVFVLKGAVSTSNLNSASPKIDLIAGALSLLLAVVLWLRRGTDGVFGHRKKSGTEKPSGDRHSTHSGRSHTSLTKRMLAHGTPKATFALGLILNLPGIWYLIALKDIAKGKHGSITAVLLILLFNAIMFLLVEVPLTGYLISPEGTRARVQRFHRWLSENATLVATVAATAIGVYLIVRALIELG
jgi:Sap, sulfolipid-1-addressing protein